MEIGKEGQRKPDGAPPLRTELALALGALVAVLALKFLQPWLITTLPPKLAACDAPDSELATRVVYIDRRGTGIVASCGPLVGGRGAFKAAK